MGYVRPGRDAADVIAPSKGTHVTATVPRDGEAQRWHNSSSVTTTTVEPPDKSNTHVKGFQEWDRCSWEWTATGKETSPTSDVLFKCVDTGSAVVIGPTATTTTEEGEEEERRPSVTLSGGNSSTARVKEKKPVEENSDHGMCPPEVIRPSSSLQETKGGGSVHPPSNYSTDQNSNDDVQGRVVVGVRRVSTTAPQGSAGKTGSDEGDEGSDDLEEQAPLAVAVPRGMPSGLFLDTDARRPQVCVPLVGAGDGGCIGMIGVQGFSSGVVIGDSDWRDWFTARMSPFKRNDNRAVKRLKFVRPRGLPTLGKLDNVPSGTAARVVYGRVEKVTRKRGLPLYGVR